MDAETSPFEREYWYAGSISERKCEEILSKTGRPGAFLVRDNILPGEEYNYVLSVYSGSEISHYNVKVFGTDECEFNGYKFTSLPEAITFYTENRLCGHYLNLPEQPVVSDKTRKGAAPVIMVAPPAPPPRSTPLQGQIVQQFSTDSASSPTLGQVDGREQGRSSSEESSSPQFPNVQQIVLRMSNPKDSPDGIPDVGNRPSTAHDVVDQKTCDDQIVAQGHVRDPSDICETSFDDITSSTCHTEVGEANKTEATPPPSPPPSVSTPEIKRDVELHSVKTKHKVAPPVPLRKSSTRTSTHFNSEEEVTVDSSYATSKAQTHSELKHLPSLKDRKEQLQAKMTDSNPPFPQSSEHVEPGKLVIHEALKGVSPGMPAAQHPLLQKKREDTAIKEREEEQGRLSREEKEKAKKRFSFMGPKTKKGKEMDPLTNSRTDPTPSKEQRRRSMPVSEQDELHNMFKHITLNRLSNPDPLPQTHTETTVRENKDEEQEGLVRDEVETEKEETDNPGFSLQPSQPAPNSPPSLPQEPPTKLTTPLNQLKSLPEHPMETELASLSSSRPSILERCTPKPPSSSPPSLPGSIDRRTRRQGNSQNNTLERQSKPGSRPGTLERKTPPPPTSQPPPVPTEIRKENTKSARPPTTSSIGFNGGRMNLVDVIVGVDRDVLLKSVAQPPSMTTASSSTPHQSGPINVKRKSIKKRH